MPIGDYEIKCQIKSGMKNVAIIGMKFRKNLNSPKAFWKAIKKVFPSKEGNSACPESIKTEEGHTITDKSTIAEKFNNFFTNAVSKLLETVQQPIVTREFSGDNFTDQKLCLLPVMESFVFKQLKGLKVKKATGLDRIPACLLKDSAAVITQSITFLVNLSLSTGIVPDEWKQARVTNQVDGKLWTITGPSRSYQ